MTQKNKNRILVASFVFMVFIAYKFPISKTLHLKKEIQLLKEQNIDMESLAKISSNLSQREKFADSLLKISNIKNTSIQNNLLEFLNEMSSERGFLINEFMEPHIVAKNEVKITSYLFNLQGNFNDLQEVIYAMEQNYSFGQLAHVSFQKKRDFRGGKDFLECFVVVESFIGE